MIGYLSQAQLVRTGTTGNTGPQGVTGTTGTDHPVYSYIGTTWTFLATNYTDWPDSLVISDTQKPFRGGYLRERVTAYKPVAGT